MSRLDDYKAAREPLPTRYKRWHLHGAGLEALEEVTLPLPTPEPGELLVRHDACGICFSDIKIINLGPEHPRLQGRDMNAHPVVMGHEVALTVVKVGDALTGQFDVGDRFIVQADVFYKGSNPSYGYVLDGGMAQYGLVTKEVLEGDEGCYLLPIDDGTNYAEAALVEPWACVVAAYEYPNYRDGLLDGGRLLVVRSQAQVLGEDIKALTAPGHIPSSTVAIESGAGVDYARVRKEETGGAGFDDVVVFGLPSAEELAQIAMALSKRGILCLVTDKDSSGPVATDVGRIHYEQHLFVGARSAAHLADAYVSNTRTDLLPGGTAWFVGAGGPMGQMHVQRAVMLERPPAVVVVTDVSDERLGRIRERFGPLMAQKGITLHLVNPNVGGSPADFGPYDDIVSMVPSAALISDSLPLLGTDGVYNIFAGLAKGTLAEIDLGAMLSKNQRIVGTSGSSIDDLRRTLELVETDALSTNASLAAIGGLDAFREGLAAVKEGRFPGKTVIFPQLPLLPLLSIDDIKTQLPAVYAKMDGGLFWTREAEDELLSENMAPPAPNSGGAGGNL